MNENAIQRYAEMRGLSESHLFHPKRVREEWRRYLPSAFQRDGVTKAILAACRALPEWIVT